MTVSNQNPTADSSLLHGDSFSFDLNDGGTTPSAIQVTVEGAATEVAWTLAGGFQAGYAGSAIKVGNVYTITLRKPLGWDASPFVVNVGWTISGTPSTASWSYTLTAEKTFPDLMTPRTQVNTEVLGTDADAIHDNVANEILGIAEKTVVADDDIFVIEDSAASGVKKSVKASNVVGLGGNPHAYFEFDTVDTAATDPGSGKFKTNAVGVSSADELYVSQTDSNGEAMTFPFGELGNGNGFIIRDRVLGWGYFKFDTTPVDNGAWWTFAGDFECFGNSWASPIDTEIVPFDFLGYGATDSTAVHTGTEAEFSPLTGKSNPVDADVLLLEDSADSFSKKKLILSNLLATLTTQSGIGIWQYAGDADPAPGSAKFSFDTGGIGIADFCYIHENNLETGTDSGTLIGELKSGDYIFIGHSSLRTIGSYHKLTGTPTLASNVWTIPLDGATSGENSTVTFTLDDYCYLLPLFAAGGSSTLDSTMTGGTPDNDVTVLTASPIIFRDQANGDVPFQILTTGANSKPAAFSSGATDKLVATFAAGSKALELRSTSLEFAEESAAPTTPAPGNGLWWVKDDAPNTPMFTNDAGVDKPLISDTLEGWNGSLLESASVTVAYSVPDIELSIEKSGTGDLTAIFGGVEYAYDTTPAKTIVLTAGTDTVPVLNYVWLAESGGTVSLVTATTGWPATAFAPVATVLCQSAATLNTDGALKVHAWTDHITSADQGHIGHLSRWIRRQNATWNTGCAANALDISTPPAAHISIDAGTVYQLHDHTFPARITPTDGIYVVNDSVSPYLKISDLDTLLNDASGVTMANKWVPLVVWGSVNEVEADCKLFLNLPTDNYANSQTDCEGDVSGFAVYDIPPEFKGTGFLIARYNVKLQASGTWTLGAITDLRGLEPSSGAQGTGVTGSGDVVGPASATDEAIALFDTTTGKLLQGSNKLIYSVNLERLLMLGDPSILMQESTTQPGASGYGEWWVKNDTPTSPMFTDETGTEHNLLDGSGDVVGPASVLGNTLAIWNGTSGKLLKDPGTQLGHVSGMLYNNSTTASIRMSERATAPSLGATYGGFWVKNDTPTSPMFTDDSGKDVSLRGKDVLRYGASIGAAVAGGWWGFDPESSYSVGTHAFSGGFGAVPAPFIYNTHHVMPYNGYIDVVEFWSRVSVTTLAGVMQVWKHTFTDGASTNVAVQLGTDLVISTGRATANRYDDSALFTRANSAFSKGDIIELWFKPDTGGTGTLNFSMALTCYEY